MHTYIYIHIHVHILSYVHEAFVGSALLRGHPQPIVCITIVVLVIVIVEVVVAVLGHE
jgi:hypothetical protein